MCGIKMLRFFLYLSTFRLLTKNHINIRIYSPQFPFLITMAEKIGLLYFTQFCESVFFCIEGFHGRKFLTIGFFFQNTQSDFVKREFCFMLLIKFITVVAFAVLGIEVFVGNVLSCKMNLFVDIFVFLRLGSDHNVVNLMST